MASAAQAEGKLSPYATPSATREVLERHGLFTKYSLGQNFLVNDDIVRKIVELAELKPSDHVLEVGPGIGTLTAALLQRAGRVTAVEMDHDLPTVLSDTLAPWANRFALLQMDALDVREGDLLGACGRFDGAVPPALLDGVAVEGRDLRGEGEGGLAVGESHSGARDRGGIAQSPIDGLPNKLVSNLPYAVAATVVLDYLQRFPFLENVTVMVQKEVADRMMAKPGTKAYGAYTVKLSLYAQAAGRFPVSPGNFFPPPRVESAVIRLDRTPAYASGQTGRAADSRVHAADGSADGSADACPLTSEELQAACRMADAAFATRRKTFTNSCKTFFASEPAVLEALPTIFEQARVDPRQRGETLAKPDFIRLGQALLALR